MPNRTKCIPFVPVILVMERRRDSGALGNGMLREKLESCFTPVKELTPMICQYIVIVSISFELVRAG
jgi:hypothetical protein